MQGASSPRQAAASGDCLRGLPLDSSLVTEVIPRALPLCSMIMLMNKLERQLSRHSGVGQNPESAYREERAGFQPGMKIDFHPRWPPTGHEELRWNDR